MGVGMLQQCGLTEVLKLGSGLDLRLPLSWPGFTYFLFFSNLIFKSSELVENNEAHSDLTEELDW